MKLNVESLADWHKLQASKKIENPGFETGSKGEIDQDSLDFHLSAAKLIESFSRKHQEARLAETEREVRIRAIESLERLVKLVSVEIKDLRKMLSDEVSDD